jgi:hypothetical protein
MLVSPFGQFSLMRCILGCAYGGTSWTTKAEASPIAELLDLRSGDELLDVGAGSGGLLTIMWGSGAGSEIMRRIAAPMIGGMITAPAALNVRHSRIYLLMHRPRARLRKPSWRVRSASETG